MAGVEQGAAGADGLAEVGVGEAGADEVAFGEGLGGGEAAAPGAAGVGLPAAEAASQGVGVAGQDQGQGTPGAAGDDLAEFAAGLAVGEQVRVVDHDGAGTGQRRQRRGEFVLAEAGLGE